MMIEVAVKLTLSDPRVAVDVQDALGDLVGITLADDRGATVEVYKVEQA